MIASSATSWSGVSRCGKVASNSCCHGESGGTRGRASRADGVELEQLLGDLAACAGAPLLPSRSRAADLRELGVSPPPMYFWTVDLRSAREHVEALELEQQEVVLGAAALDPLAGARDAVHEVDDVVAGGEVLVEVDPSLRAGAGGGARGAGR